VSDTARTKHPAKLWQNKLFWHDRSDQPETIQVIDLLHDIRFLLLVIAIFAVLA
jgi:hypothetical protein